MTDDRLLRLAGDALREPDVLDDPRWDALAAGTLDPEGVEALRALAAEDPLAAQAWEAFQPLGAAAEERFAAALEGGPAADPAPAAAGPAPAAPADAPAREPEAPRGAAVIPLRRRLLKAVALSAPLLAAAAVLLLVLRPAEHVPDLPAYAVEIGAGEQAFRATPEGPAAAPPRLGPDTRFELRLRPATRVGVPVTARAWLRRAAGGEAHGLALPFRAADGGTLVAEGRTADLIGPYEGRWELIVLVGPSSAVRRLGPDLDGLLATPPEERRWQVVRQPVLLAAP